MRKTLRIASIFVLVLVGIHLLIGGYVWISNTLYLGNVNQAYTKYLAANSHSVSNTDIIDTFFDGVLDQRFYEANVVLLGENHGFADVQRIDVALLKHLNQQSNLRYYIAEMDSTLGNLLNAYLTDNTVNEALLSKVIIQMSERIPQQASQELFAKWREIRRYNQTLPDSLRIQVLGIDKDYNDTSPISRDSMMVKNLTSFITRKNLQNEKFYGLFGYFHVMQKPVGENTAIPFACRLKKSNLSTFSQVRSMVVYHVDSQVYFPENEQFPTPEDEKISFLNDDGPVTLVKGINDLKKVTAPNTLTLFKLDEDGSPYRDSQHLAGIKVNFLGEDLLPINSAASTVDYFQYAFLGRNARALTKY